MRTDRCRDWVKLRELDDVATGMALRAVEDAIHHGGLLAELRKCEASASKIWTGKLTTVVRKI